MRALPQDRDLPQKLFTLLFFILMTAASFWVVEPFILGFAWAGMVVIATWGLMLRIQKYLWGRRSLAVLVMTLIILLVFILPIALLISSVIDNIGPVISWATSGHIEIPKLEWLNNIPLIGDKLAEYYQKMIAGGGSAMMAKIQPYVGQTTSFFVAQAGHFGRIVVHLALMLLFSALLYWRGERVGQGIRHFAYRLAGRRGDAVVLLAGQAIRAVALGVVVTALLQGIRVDKAFPMAPVTTLSAQDAYNYVLKNVGAFLPKQDAVDQRIIKQVSENKVYYDTTKAQLGFVSPYVKRRLPEDSYKQGIISNIAQVGGYPN